MSLSIDGLLIFYRIDLAAFEVPQQKINFAVKLYAQTYSGYQFFENKEAS